MTCEEMEGSPVENFAKVGAGSNATMRMMCDWASRYDEIDLLYANPAYPHGDRPLTLAEVVCTPADARQTADGNLSVYQKAILDLSYVYDPESEIIEKISPNVEFMTVDHTKFKWAGDGKPIKEAEAPGKLIKSMDYEVELKDRTIIPGPVLGMIGSVNESPVSSSTLGLTFPAQTLLYNPPTLDRVVTPGDEVSNWTIGLSFSYRVTGWNKFWRADTQTWDSFTATVDGEDVPYLNYPLDDLQELLI